jgi:phosphatidylserine decarboxylase
VSAVTYATAQLLRALPRERIGRAIGRLADRPWSPALGRAVVDLYSRLYHVELDECRDGRDWPSFDAFFTRRLRDGARRLDPDPAAVTSPADGRLEAIGPIQEGARLVVKGRPYAVEELVGDPLEAVRFVDGAGCVVYLSPRDYHRVHAPVSGHIRRIRSMPGDFYPVNAIGMRHVANVFCRNRRVAIEIDAPLGGGAHASGAWGRVTVVMVVAMIVGRITTVGVEANDVPFGDHRFDQPLRVMRGDEIGVFHLGSTAVVLAEKSLVGELTVAPNGDGSERVRYGQALWRAPVHGPEARA